jgi:hypothetical protein
MAWLTGWGYRKSITLSRASGAVTNYQMKLLVGESSGAAGEDVDCGGLCLTDFDDIRFTKSDGTTLLDYWIESVSGTTPNQLATIWIEFDSIGTGATTFYMYYGKADAIAVSSGVNTFLFFDDFNALTDGDLNGQNGWSGSTAFDVQTSTKYEGAKSVSVASVVIGQIDKTLTVTSFNVFIQLAIRATHAGDASPIEFYLMEGTNQVVGIGIAVDKVKHLIAPPSWQDVMTAVDNTWYLVRVALDSASTHKIWIDNTLKSPASNANINNVSSTINKLRLEQYVSTVSAGYIDQIIVGQYLATEPAWGSWQSQEAAPTSGWAHKILGILPSKVMDVLVANISKILNT